MKLTDHIIETITSRLNQGITRLHKHSVCHNSWHYVRGDAKEPIIVWLIIDVRDVWSIL